MRSPPFGTNSVASPLTFLVQRTLLSRTDAALSLSCMCFPYLDFHKEQQQMEQEEGVGHRGGAARRRSLSSACTRRLAAGGRPMADGSATLLPVPVLVLACKPSTQALGPKTLGLTSGAGY